MGILTLNWASDNYRDIVTKIQEGMKRLEENGMKTELMWVPGHAEIDGNES